REQVRLAEGGRSVHGDARAGARGHPPQEGGRRQPHHPGLRGGRDPGIERPLRSVHHGQEEERQDPEGPRPEDADARGVPRAARGGAGAWLEVRSLRQGQAPCRRARGCRGRLRSREVPQGRGGRTNREGRSRAGSRGPARKTEAPGPRGPQARRGESTPKKERTEKGARGNGGRRARSGARTEVALELRLSSRSEELV